MSRFGRWLSRLLKRVWPPRAGHGAELDHSRHEPVAMTPGGWRPGVTGLAVQAALAGSGAVVVQIFVNFVTGEETNLLVGAAALLALLVSAWLWYRWQGGRPPAPDPPLELPGPPPDTLPPDVSGFVGRRAQLDEVVNLADTKPAIAAVGDRGVGTSAFVLHAAHLLRSRFQDGQVYVDVRGSERRPLTSAQVLDRVCRALGLPPPRSRKHSDLDAASETLRSWLGRKRTLLVLDNVDDPDVVTPVLPNSSHSLALLAKSTTAMDLDAVHPVSIDALSTDEAVELLAQAAGRDLVGGDARSALELVRLFTGQPLAIRLLGQQLVKHGLTVENLRRAMATLTNQPRYEQEPDAPALRELWDTSDLTYQDLTPAQQRMFRLLGLVPATEIGVVAAAALANLRPTQARRVMAGLASHGLLEVETYGRYRLRKLLAGSARLHLKAETRAQQERALLRLARHLARAATTHAEALMPSAWHEAAERKAAHDWFVSEHDLLFRLVTNWHPPDVTVGDGATAAVEQPPEPVQRWLHRTAVALCVWYAEEHRLTEWHDVCRAILEMPIATGDSSVATWAHNELGAVYRQQGDPITACDELTRAVRQQHQPRAQAAQVQANLGLAWLDRLAWHDRGASHEAMFHLDTARWLSSEPYGRALHHLALSGVYLHLRDHEAAQYHIGRCLDIFDDLGDQRGLAAAQNNLGLALWLRGDHADAEEYWERARNDYTGLGDTAGMARVRLNLAAMLLDVAPRRTGEAVKLLQESLQLRDTSPDTLGTGLCHLHLGDAYAQKGESRAAREEWSQAEKIFHELGAMSGYEEAARRLARHEHDR
ncbi:MAG TPA: tetratricopeptide repeat protein [Micromonosporaceae bacterium]